CVGILDLEGLAHQVVDEVDDRTAHVDQRQLVDEYGRAVLLDGDVVVVAAVDEIELVGEAGATAAFDRDAQRRFACFLGDDRGDALCGGIGQLDLHLRLCVRAHVDSSKRVTLHSRLQHSYEARGGKSTGGAAWTRNVPISAISASAT